MGFSQALSGVNAAAKQLDVVGNNIANSQTAGFKSSSVQFSDVFANSQVGLGTRVAGVVQNFSSGSLETTGRNLDLAIAGTGFYRFEQGGQVGYSRNGQITMTADGDLVNAQGAKLMGFGLADANDPFSKVVPGGRSVALNIPADDMPAQATTKVSQTLNLDAREIAGDDLSQTQVATSMVNSFSPVNQQRLDYHYSNSFTVFDSLGNSHEVSVYYEKRPEAPNSWLGKVVMDGYYDMTADPVGQAADKVANAAVGASETVTKASTDLLLGLQQANASLDNLQSRLSNAARTAADEAGATVESVQQAVNEAARQVASEAGFSLTEVLDKYLNGQTVEPAEASLMTAYVVTVQDEMKGQADAESVATAVEALDPNTDAVNEFSKYMTAKAASIVENAPSEYASVARTVTSEITTAATGNDIDAMIAAAKSVDVNTNGNVVDVVRKAVKDKETAVLAENADPAVTDAVKIVTKKAEEADDNIISIASDAKAASPGEAFEAFGTNDFVVEFDSSGALKRVGQPVLADDEGGKYVKYQDVSGNIPVINFASDETTPLKGETNALSFEINLAGSSQYGNSSMTQDLVQNGYTSGSLVGITIGEDGTIMRNFTNEKSVAAGQIALANFRNPEGLKPAGDNLWAATGESGAEVVGVAGTGQLGSIESGMLEASNVDLTSELVDLIIAQRNYQANTNSIRTQSEVMDAIAQLR